MSQYALPLALPPVYSEDNFFVSACNREAWRWVTAWPDWPAHALLLYGSAGSGKSHLGALWATRAAAITLPAAAMTASLQPVHGPALVENIEKLREERALLHWYNYSQENGHSLLLTCVIAPQQLPFTLPDLRSRLLAIPSIHIDQPDDQVLAGALRKQFADRQIKVDDEVVAYLLPRMERSLASAKELVEWLDVQALAGKKKLTIPFVRQLLEAMAEDKSPPITHDE